MTLNLVLLLRKVPLWAEKKCQRTEMLNSTPAQKQQTDKFVYKRKQRVRTPAKNFEKSFSEAPSAKKILVQSIYKPRYFC
jgi:hypothetical protein